MNKELKSIINEAIDELRDEYAQEVNQEEPINDIDSELPIEDEVLDDIEDCEDEDLVTDEEINESLKNMQTLIERMGVEHKSKGNGKSILREHYEKKY